MKSVSSDIDPMIAALAAQRAALAAQDARAREARLAAARRREESRITEAGRVATRLGRFLRRELPRTQPTPTPLLRRHDEHEQTTTSNCRDAA